MNDNSLIKDIGRSYIISSLLPTGLFVTLGILFYKNFFFLDFLQLNPQDPLLSLQWLMFSAFVVWVAFALYSNVDWTIQFYEGYFWGKWLQKIWVQVFVLPKYEKAIKNIKDRKKLLNIQLNHGYSKEQAELISQARSDFAGFELRYPINSNDLLPTRMGNVLRACELYPRERFGFEGPVIWSRLVTLLPDSMKTMIEGKE